MPTDQAQEAPAQQEAGGPPSWESVAPHFQQAFPDLDQGLLQRRYDQALQLRAARENVQGSEESWQHIAATRAIPVLSTVLTTKNRVLYENALKRFEEGKPEPDDYDRIATHERVRELEQNASTGRAVGNLAMGVGSMAGEALVGGTVARTALGGLGAVARGVGLGRAAAWLGLGGETAAELGGGVARGGVQLPSAGNVANVAGQAATRFGVQTATQTAAMPSMWAPEWIQNNIDHQREPTDPRGMPAAFATGMMQTAILGSIGRQVNARIPGEGLRATATRLGAAGPLGLLESEAANVVSSSAGLNTGYGHVGEIYRSFQDTNGRPATAFQNAALTALTFTAFGALHEVQGHGPMEAFTEASRSLRRQGLSENAAGERLQRAIEPIVEAARNPNVTAEELSAQVAGIRSETTRPVAQTLADVVIKAQEKQKSEPAPRREGFPDENGMVRMYHGGEDPTGATEGRWVTPNLADAEGWARKGNSQVWYVDVPADHPSMRKAFDDSGTNMRSPFARTEVPAEFARKMRPVETSQPPPTAPPKAERGQVPSQTGPEARTGQETGVAEPRIGSRVTIAREPRVHEEFSGVVTKIHPDGSLSVLPEGETGTARVGREKIKSVAPETAPPARPEGVTGFKTEKGSIYTWENGQSQRTQRYKDHPEGPGGDSKALKTVFVDPKTAEQILKTPGRVGHQVEGDRLLLFGKGGKPLGEVKVSLQPEVGLVPFEFMGDTLYKNKKYLAELHPGHVITEVSGRAAEAQPTTAPAQPTLKGLWESHLAGGEVSREQISKAAGLNKQEAHVLFERLQGRTHADIGGDLNVSRQRIKQIEQAALAKSGAADSISRTVHESERQENAVRMFEQGQRVSLKDLHADPDEVIPRVQKRMSAREKAQQRIAEAEQKMDELTTQMVKEAESGELSAERRAYFKQQADRIHQQAQKQYQRNEEGQRGQIGSASEGARLPDEGQGAAPAQARPGAEGLPQDRGASGGGNVPANAPADAGRNEASRRVLMEIHHGTNRQFDKFDKKYAPETGLGERGFFFTADKSLAEGFQEATGTLAGPKEGEGVLGKRTISISIPKDKLLDLTSKEGKALGSAGNIDAKIKAAGYEGFYTPGGDIVVYDPNKYLSPQGILSSEGLKTHLSKEIADANATLAKAGEKPLTAEDHAAIVDEARQLRQSQEAAPSSETSAAEPRSPGRLGADEPAADVGLPPGGEPGRPSATLRGGIAEPMPAAEMRSSGGTFGEGPLIRTGTEKTAALAKAKVKETRMEEGLSEIERQAKQGDEQIWNAARERLAADPGAAAELAREVVQTNGKRALNTEEKAMILHRMISVRNEISQVVKQGFGGEAAGMSDSAYMRLQRRMADLRIERDLIDRASDIAGSESGRTLRIQRLLVKYDYSIEGLIRRAESAKRGQLSDEETKKIVELQEKLDGLQKKLDEAEDKLRNSGTGSGGEEYKEWERTTVKVKRSRQELDRVTDGDHVWANMPFHEKAIDLLKRLRIAELISSPVTVGKVGISSMLQPITSPTKELIASAWRLLPGIKQVAEKAPIEGTGFRPSTEAAAAKEGWTQGMRDAWQTLKNGESNLDIMHGSQFDAGRPYPWIEFFGNLHGAEKAPAVRAAYERAFRNLEAAEKAKGSDVTSPEVLKSIGQQAYTRAVAEKYQQDNAAVDIWRNAMEKLKRMESSGGQALGHALEITMPIVRTPTNIIIEAIEHVLGVPLGLGRAGYAGAKYGLKGTELTQPQAEGIMRQLKRGTLGLPLFSLGLYLGGDVAGGFYSGKRKEGDVEAGEIKTPFGTVPGWAAAHHPALIAFQVGASIRRASDAIRKGERAGLGHGIHHGIAGLLDEIPFAKGAGDIVKFDVEKFVKSIAVPQLIQWLAKVTDTRDARRLNPQGVWQNIEAGVPGLRQRVGMR